MTNVWISGVKEKYEEVKDSFLWIKNIWLADSPTQKSIPSFESYAGLAKLNLKAEEKENAKQVYNAVMGGLEEGQGVNGYFILAILAGLSAFLYQYLLTKANQKKLNKTIYYFIKKIRNNKLEFILLTHGVAYPVSFRACVSRRGNLLVQFYLFRQACNRSNCLL